MKEVYWKNKWFTLGIVSMVIIIVVAGCLLYHGLKEEPVNLYKELKTIYLNDFFDKQGEYYVYAQRSGCPYCDNVKNEIINFSETNQLYVFDTRAKQNEGIKDYDWNEHHRLYDKKVGEVIDRKIVLDEGVTEKKLKTKYLPLDYTIKRADKEFVELNVGKEEGKVYAVRESPIIDYSNASATNLIIAAVPTLFHVINGEIDGSYFGDIQILNFLGIDKQPIDKYIN